MDFCVYKQLIKRADNDIIVANSTEYLTAVFNFSQDWKGYIKTAIFTHSSGSIAIKLNENDEITADNNLSLLAGSYVVSVVGIKGDSKIITNIVPLTVQ